VLAVAPALTSAGAAPSSVWYWSQTWCEHNLHRYGMRLDDGRTFRIANSFCMGKGGPGSCEWNATHVERLFNHFTVVARSYDEVVRGFDLYPTGRTSYRAQGITIASSHRWTASRFTKFWGSIASSAERNIEQPKGCAPHSP
jgi:hypothetical protein